MIDEKTGTIEISGERLPPLAPKAHVLASPLGVGATDRKKGDGWSEVGLGAQQIDGRAVFVTLQFHDDALAGVHVMDDDPRFGDSPETADEAGRKRAHDAWLAATLGAPPYVYAWGEVGSTYDPRSDSSQIYVRYRRESP